MARREFPAKVRVAAFERAKGCCEKCGVHLTAGKIDYDHILADWLGGEPTLENCAVLCRSCHRGAGGKTAEDAKVIAKVKRVRARHIGAKPPSRRPIGDPRFIRKLDGRCIPRNDD